MKSERHRMEMIVMSIAAAISGTSGEPTDPRVLESAIDACRLALIDAEYISDVGPSPDWKEGYEFATGIPWQP